MKIRKKTMLIIGLSFACLFVILYFVTNATLLRSFKRLEEHQTAINVVRARGLLFNMVTAMNSKISDWGAWDETYKFVVDLNKKYIDENLDFMGKHHLVKFKSKQIKEFNNLEFRYAYLIKCASTFAKIN